jgi:3-oxoacyl-[acyl-carrier protein] reductase
MELKNKNALIYGGGGVIGSTIALAFAHAGANGFLAGSSIKSLQTTTKKIKEMGGYAETAILDALDKEELDKHAALVTKKAGSIDISFNAIGVFHIQDVPLTELSLKDYPHPLLRILHLIF